MFHAARALVYSKVFREKSHYALLVALRNLLVREIGIEIIKAFEDAMNLREEADYGLTFSEARAFETVKAAEGISQENEGSSEDLMKKQVIPIFPFSL